MGFIWEREGNGQKIVLPSNDFIALTDEVHAVTASCAISADGTIKEVGDTIFIHPKKEVWQRYVIIGVSTNGEAKPQEKIPGTVFLKKDAPVKIYLWDTQIQASKPREIGIVKWQVNGNSSCSI